MSTFKTAALALVIASTAACAGSGWEPEAPTEPRAKTAVKKLDDTLARLQRLDPTLERFVEQSYGYAVFPTVGKGALTLGVTHGHGGVYERGLLIGKSSVTQISLGFALGGQAFSQVIFFEDEAALRDFTSGNFELGAQASAVAVTAGASADASYDDGVAIFTAPKGGLMYDASVGGQKFGYETL